MLPALPAGEGPAVTAALRWVTSCTAWEEVSKPFGRLLLKPLSGEMVLVREQILACVLCFFYGNPKKEIFFPHFIIMSSSAMVVVVSSPHVTKSHGCLAMLLMCPYTQTRPFNMFHALVSCPSAQAGPCAVVSAYFAFWLQPPWLFLVLLSFVSGTAKPMSL